MEKLTTVYFFAPHNIWWRVEWQQHNKSSNFPTFTDFSFT